MKIAVVGLGYVGLPLVIEFGKILPTIGFDISERKVETCKNGADPSRELSGEQMRSAIHAKYSDDAQSLAMADYVIVAVPTPVDEAHIPDFKPLVGACRSIAPFLKQGAIVVFESTVYPGATEEICIPEIEKISGKIWKRDFYVGYSPERINPGDRERTLTKVIKVVSGDTEETLEKVAELYEKIVVPGVHRCSSIKVAEAAKVIENTQRDLNIALMNELAIIFNRVGIDTAEVIEAAGTKWNFLKFKPGLVGGHCIGVDPYYLTHKAAMLGYNPQVILAGRRINDGMGKYVAEQTIKSMIKNGCQVKDASINVLGVTFKENCADVRNTKVMDIVTELRSYGISVNIADPWADAKEVHEEYGEDLISIKKMHPSDACIVAVPHKEFSSMNVENMLAILKPNGVLVDVKSIFHSESFASVFRIWRL